MAATWDTREYQKSETQFAGQEMKAWALKVTERKWVWDGIEPQLNIIHIVLVSDHIFSGMDVRSVSEAESSWHCFIKCIPRTSGSMSVVLVTNHCTSVHVLLRFRFTVEQNNLPTARKTRYSHQITIMKIWSLSTHSPWTRARLTSLSTVSSVNTCTRWYKLQASL